MSLTYGFYNSRNHDRLYNANDFNEVFEGLIHDGVYKNFGDEFSVSPGTGLTVIVGPGRAWLDSTWNKNSANVVVDIPAAGTMARIDAVCLKTDHSDDVRANSFVVVSGTPGYSPSKPAMPDTSTEKYHPLAYVTVPANATMISESNIESAVGTEKDTPYVELVGSGGEYDYPWATIPDELLPGLMEKVDQGRINLVSDLGWMPGDERVVEIYPPLSNKTWYMVFVLTDPGYYELANPTISGKTHCNFVVAAVTSPNGNPMYSNDLLKMDNTNGSWIESPMRTALNGEFLNSLQPGFQSILKSFKVISSANYNTSVLRTTDDKLATFAEKEVFGAGTYGNEAEANALKQLNYFKNASNRLLENSWYTGGSRSYNKWYGAKLRSPSGSYGFCGIENSTGNEKSSWAAQFEPFIFGCI